jgi:peptide/nickel transport system substrate-binding protein
MPFRAPRSHRRTRSGAALLLAAGLLATSCGGTSSEEGSGGTTGGEKSNEELGLTVEAGESGLEEAGEPQRGGKLIYGVEAESTAGYCLSEAQLAISGMLAVRAFYDTLTVPNAEGGYSPYLARSVTPNDDYTQWTITLREGITFHDGTALDATVVKNNIDAYRGAYPTRSSLLFMFVLQDIDTTEVVDDLTVRVNTKRPWVSFPAFLFSSSRFGIMAQAQLDASGEDCATKPIGTGPFRFTGWTRNQQMTGEANPDYWQIAPDGEPYPYVDEIEFRPIPDGSVRLNSIESGAVNVIHTSDGEKIKGELLTLRDQGEVNMLVSEAQAEVSFIQLNSSIPPFDDERMRRALAHGSDRPDVNRRVNAGLPTVASGPFGPDSIGYLEDAGFPQYDQEAAKALVAEYLADNPGASTSFTLSATTDPAVRRVAELVKSRAAEIGVEVTIQNVEQATLIDSAIAGNYQAMVFRNYPGGDPDQNYVWWYGESNPVNFGRWDDAELNALLDEGREAADPAERERIYQDVNRIMAEKVYGMWSWYTPWAVVTDAAVHNIFGPPLPGDDHTQPGEPTTDDPARQPGLGLATAHSLIGLWIEQ